MPVLIVVLALLVFLADTARAESLALERVVLSTGGVAHLEYEVEVEGDAEITFDFRLDQVDDVQRTIEDNERQRQVYIEEQEHLRDNLQRVPSDSDLADRYLERLGEQEDGIESLLGELEDLREILAERRGELDEFIAGLSL